MKKIFFSLLAIGAVVSCAKTETVYTEVDSEIKLAPVAALQTKANVLAAIDGTEYPTAENFDVYGYWKADGAEPTYTDGQSYFGATGVEFVNKGNYWGGKVPYYWPKNGTLRFAAYSPSSLDLAHSQEGDTFSVNGYVQPSSTAATWDFLVAPTSAPYTAMTAAEKVSVVFEHALSWITLKVKAKDEAAADVFTIKSVTINDVNTTADFSASMLGQEMVQYESWTNWGTPAEYNVFKGTQGVTAEPTVIETTKAGTLVIPQATTNVTVVFNQKGVNGTMDMEDMVVNLDLVLDQDDEPWNPGFHYTYTLIFGLDEILINPSVDEWEEYVWNENGSNGEIDADNAANVTTEAQLAAAVAEGGKIVLQNNIALETVKNLTVAAGKTVVLDLNGYTLSSEPTATNSGTNYEMFLVKGDLTVKNGTITTEYKGTNLGWGGMTTIFDITAGGLVYLSDVEATNLGGSDMAFVAHLNNWGEATLSVDRSTLTSNYVAVRVFNSGYDKNNVSIYNSTLEGGSNAFWVHNYTAADFGSEAKAESQKALLNFDIFNGTNTFIGGKEFTPIRYGFTDAIYLDAEGNVPGNAVGAATADELQAALDAATESTTFYLSADIVGNVTVTQKAGINVTINGNGKAFDGTLTINGQSKVGTGETLVIKNVKFATENTSAMDFISSATDAVRYAENVAIEGCTFTAPEATDVVAIRIRQGYDIVVKNCEMKGGHSLAQVTSSNNIDFVGCTVESGRGINLQNALNGVANIKNCNITATKADGYGIRVDAKGANVMTVTGCTIDAFEAIVLRNAEAAYTLNLSGNTLSTEVVVLGETPVINK